MKEEVLVKKSLRRIRQNTPKPVCREVPILGRSADLAYVDQDVLFSVEFKLRDWRKAIQQARDHRLAADYSYICMPKRNVSEALSVELNKHGVGLFFYKDNGVWPFEVVIEAHRSFEVSEVARSWVLAFISEKQGRQKCQSLIQSVNI